MSDDFAHVRLVDFTEHPVMLLVSTDGSAELIGEETMCKLQLAALLSIIARDLVAEAMTEECAPTGEPPVWERPDEPLLPHGGTLDRVARVWTDGTGHVWDLGVQWRDAYGRAWRWHGDLDRSSGAPMMRCEYRDDEQPLDVLRAMCGPIHPISGGAA
ncbi:phiSA1p31-related protein [Streptomyces sp. UP1A-1]|nr:phiSA1p31-related protein [Streptomyces sp. UP1A-1]